MGKKSYLHVSIRRGPRMTLGEALAALLSGALGEGCRATTPDEGNFDHVSLQVGHRLRGLSNEKKPSQGRLCAMRGGGQKTMVPRDETPCAVRRVVGVGAWNV